MGVILVLLLLILLGAGYFLPTIIAVRREHPNRWLIFVLNVAFGATFVGWVIALIWALNAAHRPQGGGSAGGESGLNLFANDVRQVQLVGTTPLALAAPAQTSLGEVVEQIERIKLLLDQGVIDYAEFNRLKDRMLREV